MDEKLRLNKTTGYYEATFTLKVEAEIFQRAFFRYVEENHLDISDVDAVQQAVQDVSQVSRWMLHPRTEKSFTPPVIADVKPVEQAPTPSVQLVPMVLVEKETPLKRFSFEEEESLRERALLLPIECWEDELLTPLPQDDGAFGVTPEKRVIYQRRTAERKFLNRLREEMEEEKQASSEVLVAVADAVNGARFK